MSGSRNSPCHYITLNEEKKKKTRLNKFGKKQLTMEQCDNCKYAKNAGWWRRIHILQCINYVKYGSQFILYIFSFFLYNVDKTIMKVFGFKKKWSRFLIHVRQVKKHPLQIFFRKPMWREICFFATNFLFRVRVFLF